MRTSEAIDRDFQGRRFGRGRGYSLAAIAAPSTLASDLRLFALTFVSGFLFVIVYIA
jgi:hypothetical protein